MEVLELRNGLKVIFSQLKGVNILACSVFVPRGSAFEPVEKAGITSLSLKTAFKRSLKRNTLEFSKIQEVYGTPFVPDVSNDYLNVRFQIVPEGLDKYLELFKEVLEAPGFVEDSFSVEKETLLAAIRSRKENPFALAFERMTFLTYGGTPYEALAYGTEESVKNINLEDVKSWFKNLFLLKGTVFSFSGKLNKKEKEKIVEFLENLETKEKKESLNFEKKIESNREVTVKREGSHQSFIMIAVNAPSVFGKDYAAYKLLNTLLGEGIGSVLFQELREKRGFAYSTGSLFPSRKCAGRLFFYIGTSKEKEEEVKKALIELKENLVKFITPESVKRAKEFFKGNFGLDHETRMKKSWYLGFWEVMGKKASFDKEILELIDSVSVSKLKEVAERIASEPYHMVVVKDG
ncbi:MAG: pitrilysin family protein [Desulfurobacteriaceae bacterium]